MGILLILPPYHPNLNPPGNTCATVKKHGGMQHKVEKAQLNVHLKFEVMGMADLK
jgi:hypothetical protein